MEKVVSSFEDLAKVVSEQYPAIHVNEVAVWKFMIDKGGEFVSRLMEAIINAPPKDIVEHMIATLVVICHNLPGNYKQQWFTVAFARVPNNILTEEEKINQMNDII